MAETSEMVARVARAMCIAAMEDPDHQDDLGEPHWRRMVPLAEGAIWEMREPTAPMTEAGRWPAEDDGPVACWTAMVDAALAAPPTSR